METRVVEQKGEEINPDLKGHNTNKERIKGSVSSNRSKMHPDQRDKRKMTSNRNSQRGNPGQKSMNKKKTYNKKNNTKKTAQKRNTGKQNGRTKIKLNKSGESSNPVSQNAKLNKQMANKIDVKDKKNSTKNAIKNAAKNTTKNTVKNAAKNTIKNTAKNTVKNTSKKTAKKTEKIATNKTLTPKKKSISVDPKIYDALKRIRDSMSAQLGGRITFNIVVQSLLNDHYDLENTRSELKEIQKQTEETTEYIKEMLKLALVSNSPGINGINGMPPGVIPNYPNSPQYPNSNPNQTFPNTNNVLRTPPPPPPSGLNGVKNAPQNRTSSINKIKSSYKPPNTGNLKKDYVKEIKQIFKGEFLKPSDILGIAKPAHKDSAIKFIDEDAETPDIFENSVAKNFKNMEGELNV